MSVKKQALMGLMVLPLGASVLSGCAQAASTTSGGATGSAESVSWLLAMGAAGGTYDGESATLTLTRTDAQAVAFTDRPDRQVARVNTASFLDAWDQTFGGDPPNAVVVVSDADADQDMIAVELGVPSYTADATVTFPVTLLEQAPAGVPQRDFDDHLPASFGDAAVFIDYISQLCPNLSQCPDGQQVGGAWPSHESKSRPHKTAQPSRS